MSNSFEVVIRPTPEGHRYLDVFPPIPQPLKSPIFAKLSSYMRHASDKNSQAYLRLPVNIEDELYGEGSRFLVVHFSKHSVLEGLSRRLLHSLGQYEDPSTWTTVTKEASDQAVIENIEPNPQFL